MHGQDITGLLSEWAAGGSSALDRLAPLVYPQLKQLAASFLRSERRGHTLQPTVLVNELFLRLMERREPNFENRRHFYALSARLMRYALIDHARAAKAGKRPDPSRRVPLNEELSWIDAAGAEALDLDAALTELASLDPEQTQMVEMRYLLGCSVEETAAILGTSESTVDRKVRLARAWLYQKLRGNHPLATPAPQDQHRQPAGGKQ